jgi:hypothetical protein
VKGNLPAVQNPKTELESVPAGKLMGIKRISLTFFRQGETENDRKLRNKVGFSGDVILLR